MELARLCSKPLLVGGVAVLLIWNQRDEIFGLLAEPLEAGLAQMLIDHLFLLILVAALAIVAADVPFQLWRYFDKLKMTRKRSSRK